MELRAFVAAAALLGLERATYVYVWHRPDAFARWSRRAAVSWLGPPLDVLSWLFVAFKGLQAAVFAGWCIVHGGGLEPVSTSPAILAAGAALVGAGQWLNAAVFRALGRTGVFYGCRLGHQVPWRDAFPFSWFEHPQYVGTVLTIWGIFVVMRFPAPDWAALPVLETVYYAIGARLEQDRPRRAATPHLG